MVQGSLTWDYCPGCDGKEVGKIVTGDHVHQYISGFGGEAVTVWVIDGTAYSNHMVAAGEIMKALECTNNEAHTYLDTLRRVYS